LKPYNIPHRSGILIAIEGIDGAGKTTQARFLADEYRGLGWDVVVTKEPTSGPWGKLIRDSAKNGRLAITEEVNAFIEDRKEHVREVIRPCLEQEKVVIADRYYLSTAAYQGARGLDTEELLQRNEDIAPEPDLAIILNVPVHIAIARIAERGDVQDHFEKESALLRVAECFERIQRPYVCRLDGSRSIRAVTSVMLGLVEARNLLRSKRSA